MGVLENGQGITNIDRHNFDVGLGEDARDVRPGRRVVIDREDPRPVAAGVTGQVGAHSSSALIGRFPADVESFQVLRGASAGRVVASKRADPGMITLR